MNNPLYIPHSSIEWKGMTREQNDPRFVQFKYVEYGFCAAFLLFFHYRKKYGCNTIRQFISVWGSPYSIKVDYLSRYVSLLCGYPEDKPIAGYDLNTFIDLMAALSYAINNRVYSRRRICYGLWYAIRYRDKVDILA